MSAALEIIPLNLPDVEAKFGKLGSAITNKVLETAAKEAARPIEAEWKARARRRSRGRVARSIKVRTESKDSHGVAVAVVSTAAGFFGFEYGTSREAPHPAARPAFDQHKGAAVDTFQRVVRDLFEGSGIL